jgi:hypothetical protein
MRTTIIAFRMVLLAGALAAADLTSAQPAPPEHDVTALAKATQNPVGDLTSLPFQFNFNTGGDLADQTYLHFIFQPVIPFKLSDDWNIISRTIVPIDSVPSANGQINGVGDIQEQLYLTPTNIGKLIWGAGPVFSFPTATSTAVRTGTWAGGVGVVALTMSGPWVVGALVNQYWPMSYAGGEPKTDLFIVQPFVNYNFGRGWAVAFGPSITANWDAPAGNQWTVPLGLGVSRTTVLSGRPMTVGIHYYYNVKKPQGSAGEFLRFSVSLLYPRK